MDIILLHDLPHVGKLGEEVKVKPGYARNYLIPRKQAVLATAANRTYFLHKKEELLAKRLRAKEQALLWKESLEALGTMTIHSRASVQDGKLFGSVTGRDVAKQLSLATGYSIHPTQVAIHSAPIRTLGEYAVQIHLDAEVTAQVLLLVAQLDTIKRDASPTT